MNKLKFHRAKNVCIFDNSVRVVTVLKIRCLIVNLPVNNDPGKKTIKIGKSTDNLSEILHVFCYFVVVVNRYEKVVPKKNFNYAYQELLQLFFL